MEEETAPRERKIRRGIVMLSSSQIALGAVIIGMSFTAFASTSSAKIRGSSPYWAGFMALFTGSVGFLTWKQLSIVSIGIYTFLSTACVVVSLVATVLTGDSAGFLKTFTYCTEVKFEHACQCCVTNVTCTPPYKFQSIRDCSIIHGFLKDIMYSLCVANILCCIMSLTVTLVGCTLGAQYSRYSQNCAFRWSHPPPQPDYDHRYNWSPYPTDPISNLPPWAPPIYYPVPSTSRGAGYQCRRPPPTLFDSVDFPPPYTSREPSIAGRRTSQDSLGIEYALDHHRVSWDRLGHSVFRFFRQGTAVTVSEDSFDYIDQTDVRVLASSSGTSEGVLHHGDLNGPVVLRRTLAESVEGEALIQSQGAISHDREILRSSSTESDSETPHDIVFTSGEACTIISDGFGPGNTRLARTNEQVGPRRHSWTPQIRTTRSSNVYSAHDEIYHSHIAPNVNPWARSMSENEAHGRANGNGNISLPVTKQRSNSTPCYTTYHVTRERNHGDSETCTTADDGRVSPEITEASHVDNPSPSTVCPHENRGLFRNFTESSSKSTRTRPRKKRRRPRNNPGHILEHGSSGCKEVNTQDSSGLDTTESARAEYRETTL